MIFNIHPWEYSVVVCPGPLWVEGQRAAAMAHKRQILLCGTLDSDQRLEALLDQLYLLRVKNHGPLTQEGFPSFIADTLQQLMAQGGAAAVAALAPPPVQTSDAEPIAPQNRS